jgi:hypothetical protein
MDTNFGNNMLDPPVVLSLKKPMVRESRPLASSVL